MHCIDQSESPILRILLVFASPVGTSSLRLQSEEKVIRESIRIGKNSNKIKLDILPACTANDLSKHLQDNQDRYDVLHFSGHTDRINLLIADVLQKISRSFSDKIEVSSLHDSKVLKHFEHIADSIVNLMSKATNGSLKDLYAFALQNIPLSLKTGEQSTFNHSIEYTHQDLLDIGVGSLVFEGEEGRPVFIHPKQFSGLLSTQQSLKCVVLNACGSKLSAELLHGIIPMSICFDGKISDVESVSFSRGFYSALAEGLSFSSSFAQGKSRMELGALLPGTPFRPRHLHHSFANLLVNDDLVKSRTSLVTRYLPADPSDDNKHNEKDREIQILQKCNSQLSEENLKMQSLVSYGMELLATKEKELEQLRLQKETILRALDSSFAPEASSHCFPALRHPSDEQAHNTSHTASSGAHSPTSRLPLRRKTSGLFNFHHPIYPPSTPSTATSSSHSSSPPLTPGRRVHIHPQPHTINYTHGHTQGHPVGHHGHIWGSVLSSRSSSSGEASSIPIHATRSHDHEYVSSLSSQFSKIPIASSIKKFALSGLRVHAVEEKSTLTLPSLQSTSSALNEWFTWNYLIQTQSMSTSTSPGPSLNTNTSTTGRLSSAAVPTSMPPQTHGMANQCAEYHNNLHKSTISQHTGVSPSLSPGAGAAISAQITHDSSGSIIFGINSSVSTQGNTNNTSTSISPVRYFCAPNNLRGSVAVAVLNTIRAQATMHINNLKREHGWKVTLLT